MDIWIRGQCMHVVGHYLAFFVAGSVQRREVWDMQFEEYYYKMKQTVRWKHGM